MANFNIEQPLNYVGFATALNLFSDLRILLMLKKEGYQFEKIKFIDPLPKPFLEFIQLNNHHQGGAAALFFEEDIDSLESLFHKNEHHFRMIMNAHIFEQFLLILANYPGQDTVEYYSSVEDYITDNTNSGVANIIWAADLFTVDHAQKEHFTHGRNIQKDFFRLIKHNPDAMFAILYADFLAENGSKRIRVSSNGQRKKRVETYDLVKKIGTGIEELPFFIELCLVCKNVAGFTCPCKKVHYCSKECQKKDWPKHKLNYHGKT